VKYIKHHINIAKYKNKIFPYYLEAVVTIMSKNCI